MHCPLRTKVTEIQCLLCPLEEVGSVKQSKLEKLQLLGEEEEKNTASLETTGWGGEMHSGKAAVRDPWWWQGRASLWSSVLLCFSLGAVWVHPSVLREHPCCSGALCWRSTQHCSQDLIGSPSTAFQECSSQRAGWSGREQRAVPR